MRTRKLAPCPFHGCKDLGVVTVNGYRFIQGFKCGVRGQAYSVEVCGDETSLELAILDWNTRKDADVESGILFVCTPSDMEIGNERI